MTRSFVGAQVPFDSLTPVEVAVAVVKDGRRLAQPERCSDALFALMTQLWATEPTARPAIADVRTTLLELAKTDVEKSNSSDDE